MFTSEMVCHEKNNLIMKKKSKNQLCLKNEEEHFVKIIYLNEMYDSYHFSKKMLKTP